ncbi:MAG: hypothetical protein JOY98_13440 [Candidatus Eremiobacteraeota bacterium]|nr:hypothetical protein [Candidatus Eremiobacteraeota bacterium]
MKIVSLAALLAALTMPIAVSAQATQPAPAQTQAQTQQASYEYHRWTKRLANISLSNEQQQQVQHLLDQFAASHPAGSPRDREGARALHQQILNVLTPQQQAQYQQEMHAEWAQRHQAQQQRLEQQQQQPAQQAPPPQR